MPQERRGGTRDTTTALVASSAVTATGLLVFATLESGHYLRFATLILIALGAVASLLFLIELVWRWFRSRGR
jgi:hypothetical protein